MNAAESYDRDGGAFKRNEKAPSRVATGLLVPSVNESAFASNRATQQGRPI
jgi:hypothetical protein